MILAEKTMAVSRNNAGIRVHVTADNLDATLARIGKRLNIPPQDRNITLRIGYRAFYAIYQHENLYYHHKVGKAKFLEDPIRRLRGAMIYSIRNLLRQGVRFRDALLINGRFLLSESKKECPVDTGFLRDSGYVEVGRR